MNNAIQDAHVFNYILQSNEVFDYALHRAEVMSIYVRTLYSYNNTQINIETINDIPIELITKFIDLMKGTTSLIGKGYKLPKIEVEMFDFMLNMVEEWIGITFTEIVQLTRGESIDG
jgi:hypothetical protein